MAIWSFAPWLIALLIAAGLGAFGWISDHKSRRRRAEAEVAEAEQSSYSDQGSWEEAWQDHADESTWPDRG
jgi:hypothetical protein